MCFKLVEYAVLKAMHPKFQPFNYNKQFINKITWTRVQNAECTIYSN